ncbi:MAG: hypothetical protein WDW38_001020 [Sanguina aurantia]
MQAVLLEGYLLKKRKDGMVVMVFPERMLRLRVEKTEDQGKWCAALEGAVGAIDHKGGVAQGKLLASQRKAQNRVFGSNSSKSEEPLEARPAAYTTAKAPLPTFRISPPRNNSRTERLSPR